MNLTSLIRWSLGVILGLTTAYNIDEVHKGIITARAKLIQESRASTWGSPRFFSEINKKKLREKVGGK